MKTTNPIDAARIELLLSDLRLPAIKVMWAKLAEQSDKEGWPAARFLAVLAEHEIADRGRRRIERHLAEARLPVGKTLAGFDFEAVLMVSRAQVMALTAGDSRLEKGANLLLFGPPGGGKSHLAAAIGLALVENGWRVLFMRTSDLVQRLQIARRELALESALAKLDKYHLLILDDIVIMPIAERAKILLMATGPNATEITGKNCNRYTFRVDLPNKVTVNTVYPSLKEHGKKWYFVAASYAWGIDAYNQMKDVLVKDGGTVLGFDQAPLGTTDFSSYILKLRQANPDVVYVGIGGSDLTNFLKQLHEIGMTRKMPLSSPIINDSDLWAAGPEAAFGTFPKLWNYTGTHNTPRSQQFAKTYQQKNGQPPEVEAWQDWFGTTAILTAIKETKSTDSRQLIGFLEQHKFEGYKDMPVFFRDFDHQLIQPTLVASVKEKITEKYDYFDITAEFPKEAGKGIRRPTKGRRLKPIRGGLADQNEPSGQPLSCCEP